ncbi:helix-turn-helix domain-containing protein [Limnoglobus roseus]|uniref:XRE family transcriptional regulator n=1 Tax=Limnoglobus roseus TaxID=2598579 RepID=A0A5C1AIE6_9BACT|nr:helix-turn-helix transcriptional regulator [Limnoglobus roseus]QEL17776.1 XRE family transcriptional regulator [Limnoglobus roseus]
MGKKKGRADVRERFGFAVKARREELGLTQEGLAAAARIHRTYLSDVERGTRNLSLVNVERLAAALDLSLAALFSRVDAGAEGPRPGGYL